MGFLQNLAIVGASVFCLTSAEAFVDVAPMAYPTSLLEVPATLAEPPADFLRLGKPIVRLEVSSLEDVARLTNATRLREGHGVFSRDVMCLSGTEQGKPVIAWLVASDTEHVSEVQLLRQPPETTIPQVCRALPAELLPFRLGRIGIGMTPEEVEELVGPPSRVADDGWHYWFSQRFLRNARNLQELELNWLAVRYKHGCVDKAFISLVKNP